ncbi:MAG: hypothetical protein HYV07_10045 [Deltaproteobacteria bacterium]|nr:hypothetical protein [Deltaproteobacteria bacterium]
MARLDRVIQRASEGRILATHLKKGCLNFVVFGPGRGESIVVVLPDGSVGVVDGCREKDKEDPVRELVRALMNLDWIKHELAFVCVTHPHDDHYAGIGALLEEFHGRVQRIWTVVPVAGRYGKALTMWIQRTWAGEYKFPDDPSFRGLERLVDSVHNRHPGTELDFLSRGKRLAPVGTKSTAGGVQVWSIGPSDHDVQNALTDLVGSLARLAGLPGRTRPIDANLTSGALLIKWGKAQVLLAGDLLTGSASTSGWEHCGKLVQGRVQVVNVAHHASEGAHHPSLWKRMAPKLAIVTPFMMAAGTQPPQKSMLDELSKASQVIVTTPPSWVAPTASVPDLKLRSPFPVSVEPVPTPPRGNKHNAVGVVMNRNGGIERVMLGGDALVYP